ncbi:unnamed protein product [Bemisia tabaci]|uniref:FAD-dependent oxidoreductase domain-containing protein 1 n=1 Tax=Bemisia tabaci TaxID=7038 RepID=A0A9P0ADS9_BEMTA|nr:unnamed protein product [Bemisia tabaci]
MAPLRFCRNINFLWASTESKIHRAFNRSITTSTVSSKKYEEAPPKNPAERSIFALKKGLQRLKKRLDDPNNEYPELTKAEKFRSFPTATDVLVIGAGAMGSSVAYWLKEEAGDALDVLVIDKDFSVMEDVSRLSEYAKASTVLSVGGVRQQFSLPENIKMSLFGAEFLQNIEHYLSIPNEFTPNIQFQPDGYLFLATEKSAHILEQNSKLQWELGAKNELLTPAKLKKKFPWINTEGICLGCHGLRNEGWFDPWTLLQAFKSKAMYYGAKFYEGEVIHFQFDEQVIAECHHTGERHPALEKAYIKIGPDEIKEVQFAICVICAGPESGRLAKLAGVGSGAGVRSIELPIVPRKRYVFTYRCPDGPSLNCPLTVDPSGVYFRREGFGNLYLAGLSPEPHEEPNPENLEVDYEWFDEKIWPQIAKRAPCFENIKLLNAWAGYYETNLFDENGFVGLAPSHSNLYIAAGFSGHGIQQSPAVGRAIMELIMYHKFIKIDLERLSPERILLNKPIYESNIV